MSLNSVLEQKYLPDVEALYSLLVRYLGKWRAAQTQEDRLLVESETLDAFERLLSLAISFEEVEAGQNPDSDDMQNYFTEQDNLLRGNFARLRKIAEQYIKYFNTQRIALLELTGKLRRIKQKRSTLALWDQEEARFAVAESFLTLDRLAANFVSDPECYVDTGQGNLLLPVRNTTKVAPEKVRIITGSNGQPGNSDIEVTTNNNKPDFMLNQSPDDWFEYERMDSGPLELVMMFEFAQEQILNQIMIEPINLGFSNSFQVKEITFTGSAGKVQGIRELIPSNISAEALTVKPLGNDVFWTLNHLPVRAKSVTIRLIQGQPYQVKVATRDRREVLRDRYAIGIKNLGFNRVEYMEVGGINSTEIQLADSLYAALPVVDIFPSLASLYTIKLDASFDGGATWQEDLLAGGSLNPTTALLQGTEASMVWRARLQRNSQVFSNLTSLNGTEPRYKIDSLLRTVSKYQSPAEIPLPEKPSSGKVMVIQPKILRRGDKYKGLVVNLAIGDTMAVPMPFSVLDHDIDRDALKVLVNNREWDRVDDKDTVGLGTWAFSDDYKEIILSEHVAPNSRIKVLLDEERMWLEERADGFYHKMELLFDPDEENISITLLPREEAARSLVIPKGKKVITLSNKNLATTVTLAGTDTYTEVASRGDLTTAGDYYVDRVNGILYLYEALTDDDVRVTYKHQNPRTVSPDSFEVIYEQGKPWGLRIDKEILQGYSQIDTVGQPVETKIDILTGRPAARDDLLGASNPYNKTLTYNYPIRGSLTVSSNFFDEVTDPPQEVDFIDGYSEFLGLIEMNTESTTEQTVEGGVSVATFTLSAGALWHSELGITFSDTVTFGTLLGSAASVNSAGEYHIDTNTGLVTVFVGLGGTLTGGIEINYLYRDPGFNPTNKYSVDYRNGTIHTYSAMRDGAEIAYKAAPMKVSYDVALEVDKYQYLPDTNTVRVRTEGLFETNSMVKVLWAKPSSEAKIDDLKSFFTPMVTTLGFRLN